MRKVVYLVMERRYLRNSHCVLVDEEDGRLVHQDDGSCLVVAFESLAENQLKSRTLADTGVHAKTLQASRDRDEAGRTRSEARRVVVQPVLQETIADNGVLRSCRNLCWRRRSGVVSGEERTYR